MSAAYRIVDRVTAWRMRFTCCQCRRVKVGNPFVASFPDGRDAYVCESCIAEAK